MDRRLPNAQLSHTGTPPSRDRGHRGHRGGGLRISSFFHENILVGAGSGFVPKRGRTGAGTGAGGAFEGAETDAEDAAAAVADADLDLRPAVGAGHGEALSDEGLVEGVGGMPPGFAGLAHERGDAASGGVRQKVGVLLVEPADGLDHVLAGDGAAFDQADPFLLEQRAENGDESLGWLEVFERASL